MKDTVREDPQSPDDKGALEEEIDRISTIRGPEVLGYSGEAREEHSGQNRPRHEAEAEEELADNRQEDLE
jgi:hypothetical protein